LVLREATTSGDENHEDRPIDADGEESDGILIFDRVFIPWEFVFSYRNPKISTIYNTLGQFAFWKICTRLSYRAELFAGAAQLIVDALGTDHIPAVRALVSEVIHYAATLRGLMTASVERAKPTESGVMLPDHIFVTAGRLHSIEAYPRIMQILRELSGQGLIGRVPQKSWDRPDIGPLLDRYLPGHKLNARQEPAIQSRLGHVLQPERDAAGLVREHQRDAGAAPARSSTGSTTAAPRSPPSRSARDLVGAHAYRPSDFKGLRRVYIKSYSTGMSNKLLIPDGPAAFNHRSVPTVAATRPLAFGTAAVSAASQEIVSARSTHPGARRRAVSLGAVRVLQAPVVGGLVASVQHLVETGDWLPPVTSST
jgi:hypothetical protein